MAKKVYITKSGDTWDMVAKEVYGDELYTSLLMSNNQELIEYFVFPENISIVLPEIPKEEILEADNVWYEENADGKLIPHVHFVKAEV